MPHQEEQVSKPVKRGPGRTKLLPERGYNTVVNVKMTKDQRRKMEETATDADLSLSTFIRQSVAFCCAPDVLSEIQRQLREERERNDPEVRKLLDEMRRKSKSARRRT